MRVTVIVKEKESNERAISRFNKAVQASRKLLKIRTERYNLKVPKKKYVRDAAIKREFYRSKREKSRFY
ncbi:hypothetical protein HY604_02855 [Candidatus Peregrinibacteria bacterium]|nr:hypothetical protein [Candidatus Peregrinibacteria bacterium]